MSTSPASDRATLEPLADQWAVLLTTFRRDGSSVSTPVNIVIEGGRAYIRTYNRSGKASRLRADGRARVAPCTWRGEPTGPAVEMRARLLGDDEARHAARLIDCKHPFFQRIFVRVGHRLRGYRTLHYALRPQ